MNSEKAIDYIVSRMRKDLPSRLLYHSLDHTIGVMKSARHIAEAEGVNHEDMKLLLTAAAYHDSGLLKVYEKHEEVSCELAREHLPQFGFTAEQVKAIEGMIRATRVPQSPVTHLEKILCDADLFYLGGEEYESISQRLYDELLQNGYEISDKEWLDIQIAFLKEHHYWTDYSLSRQAANKQAVLSRLEERKKSLIKT